MEGWRIEKEGGRTDQQKETVSGLTVRTLMLQTLAGVRPSAVGAFAWTSPPDITVSAVPSCLLVIVYVPFVTDISSEQQRKQQKKRAISQSNSKQLFTETKRRGKQQNTPHMRYTYIEERGEPEEEEEEGESEGGEEEK